MPDQAPDDRGDAERAALLLALGQRVAARRAEIGLTLVGLAERAQVHHTTLSRFERGAQDLGVSKLGSLAAALELNIADLFPPPGVDD